MVITSACHAEGRGFESLRSRHFKRHTKNTMKPRFIEAFLFLKPKTIKMTDSIKYLVHFTTRRKLELILESGYIMPAEQTGSMGNPTDRNKVCFFKNFHYHNLDIVERYKALYAKSKFFPEFGVDFSKDDVVGILIDEALVPYDDKYHNEKIEIKSNFPNEVDEEFYEALGRYVKTTEKVPVNSYALI